MPVTAGSDAHTLSMLGYTWTGVDAGKNVDDVIEAIRKGKCIPEGTIIPYIHRTIRFYSGLAFRHLSSSPSEIIAAFSQAWSGSYQIPQESDVDARI